MQDIAGIDVGARIRQYLKSIGKSRAEGPQSAIPDRLFEMGALRSEDRRRLVQVRRAWQQEPRGGSLIDQLAEEEAKKRGIARRPVSDEEILARITTALANEGARVPRTATRPAPVISTSSMSTASASRATAADRLYYADTVGLPTVLSRVHEYRARFGDYWEPAPLLEKLVAEGRGFYSEAAAAT